MTDKSLISGGNAEALPAGAAEGADNAADKSTADTLYKDGAPEGDATENKDAGADKAAQDGDKKAEGDKPGEEKSGDKKDADEGKKDDKAKDGDKDGKDEGEYTPPDLSDLEMPEGFVADPEVMDELGKFVTERKLNKEDAAALVPIGAKIADKLLAQQNDAYAEIRAGWRNEVVNDKELGTREQMAIADKGLSAFGTPALRKLLDETGLGDHPEIIRAFHKIGKTVSEDVIERGGSGDSAVSSAADAMYPTMKR